MTPRWTADLPRALLRALFAALGVLLLMKRQAFTVGGVVVLVPAGVIGLGTIPLTILEGRLAVREVRLRPWPAFFVLWAAAALLVTLTLAQTTWTLAVVGQGFEAGLSALQELSSAMVHSTLWPVLVVAFCGGCLAAASVAALERGKVRGVVAATGLLGLQLCVPGIAILSLVLMFTVADALAAWLLGERRATTPELEALQRLLRSGTVVRSRVWLLAYLGDPVAGALFGIDPPPGRELGAWLERLEQAGRWAGVRAALAAARLVLPRLRALNPDDLRADAVIVAVEAWLEDPRDETLADVRAAVGLLDLSGPEADAVRTTALGCEGTDRWAARGAAMQAAAAGQAAVAAGHEPDAVLSAVREALLAWAAIPGLAPSLPAPAPTSARTFAERAAAAIGARFAPAPEVQGARFVLWREDDDGARHPVETFADERVADDARRTFDAAGAKQRYWVERAAPGPPPPPVRWAIWRQDDNGARYRIDTFTEERAAEDACRSFERGGHKQRYWVERSG